MAMHSNKSTPNPTTSSNGNDSLGPGGEIAAAGSMVFDGGEKGVEAGGEENVVGGAAVSVAVVGTIEPVGGGFDATGVGVTDVLGGVDVIATGGAVPLVQVKKGALSEGRHN